MLYLYPLKDVKRKMKRTKKESKVRRAMVKMGKDGKIRER